MAATAATLTATLGLAAASWVVAVRQMNGMDMGVATRLGSFPFFVALWVSMMAAMMLPGVAPAVLRRVRASGRVRAAPLFVGSYLAVWTIVGVAGYPLYRPHGSLAAGRHETGFWWRRHDEYDSLSGGPRLSLALAEEGEHPDAGGQRIR